MIYSLFDTKGIERVESDFYEIYQKNSKGVGDYTVNIYYNSKIISKEKWEKIEKEIDIYL